MLLCRQALVQPEREAAQRSCAGLLGLWQDASKTEGDSVWATWAS